jgi:iron complex outermembrane receptor protein
MDSRAAHAAAAPTAGDPLPLQTSQPEPTGLAAATDTSADGNRIEEVTVHARRQAENQQLVPVAVTVVDPDQIGRRGNFDPLDIAQLAPGLNVQSANSDKTNYYFTIRGESFTTGTLYSSVLPYFSEVPFSRLFPGTFFDMENVQVLRGPQGTLFGRVTNGGAILLQPTQPGNTLQGYISQDYGSWDLHTTAGALTVPVIPQVLSIRAAFELGRQDGYVRNIATGLDTNDTNYNSFRLSVRFSPTANFDNLLTVQYHWASESGTDSRLFFVNPNAVLANLTPLLGPAGAARTLAQLQLDSSQQLARSPTQTAFEGLASNRRRALFVVDKTSLTLTPGLVVRNIAGYMQYKQFVNADYDGSTVAYLENTTPVLPNNLDDREQYSDELQLQASLFAERLKLTVGGYADENKNGGPTESTSRLYGILQSVQTQEERAKSLAGYAQAGYDLGWLLAGLKVNGGVRYTQDTNQGSAASYVARIPAPGQPDPIPHGQCLTSSAGLTGLISVTPCVGQSTRIDTFTYMYGLDYQIDAQTLTYAKLSRGYRPGGFNFVPNGSAVASYRPELDLSREIGLKSDWFMGPIALRTNIAAFYDTKSNIQERATIPVNGISYSGVLNANRATIKGVEAEATIQPNRQFRMVLHYAYSISHNNLSGYTAAYIAAACPADPYTTAPDATKACPLNQIARLPRNVVALEPRYSVDLEDLGRLDFGGSFYYTSGQWGTDNNYITPDVWKPGYSLINADIRWSDLLSKPLDVSLFVTNLADRKYFSSRGAVSQMGSLGIDQGDYGDPRMIGVSLRYRFGEPNTH